MTQKMVCFFSGSSCPKKNAALLAERKLNMVPNMAAAWLQDDPKMDG